MGVDIKQNDDGTMSLHSEQEGIAMAKVGGPATATPTSPQYRLASWLKLPLVGTVTAAGGVLSWQNPFPYDIIVTGAALDVTTIATGAGGVDIGYTTVSGATAATNIISNKDVHSGAICVGEDTAPLRIHVAAGKWITGSAHSAADLTGLVGTFRFQYQPA